MSLTPDQRKLIEDALETRGPKSAHEFLFNNGLALPYTTVKYVYDNRNRKDRRCLDCNAQVHYRSERCKSCAPKALAANPDVCKGGSPQRRPMPIDFPTLAATTNNKQLRAHYRCHHIAIQRWREECGVAAPSKPSAMDGKPEGFHLTAPSMTLSELRVRYGKSANVIRAWLASAGVSPRRGAPGGRTHYKPAPSIKHVENSLAGRAVDECLQKLGPVYRCDARGVPLADGFFWNRGGYVLTDDEVIDRACRNGWNPDAWRAVA